MTDGQKIVPRSVAEQYAEEDPTLAGMIRKGLPLCRDTYLMLDYDVDLPGSENWTAEHEMGVPECFRDPDAVQPHPDKRQRIRARITVEWGKRKRVGEAPGGATITVEWGYEDHSLMLSARDWDKVRRGEKLTLEGPGYFYEEEFFQDYWSFSGGMEGVLVVTYGDDGGTGFTGHLKDAIIETHD